MIRSAIRKFLFSDSWTIWGVQAGVGCPSSAVGSRLWIVVQLGVDTPAGHNVPDNHTTLGDRTRRRVLMTSYPSMTSCLLVTSYLTCPVSRCRVGRTCCLSTQSASCSDCCTSRQGTHPPHRGPNHPRPPHPHQCCSHCDNLEIVTFFSCQEEQYEQHVLMYCFMFFHDD